MSSVERPVVELLRNAVGQSGEEGARTAAVHHRGVEVRGGSVAQGTDRS